jgi:hypothetical protein
MCVGSMLLGKAIGGRTGAIIGGGLGGGIPGALTASVLFKKPQSQQTFGGGYNGDGSMS